MDDVTQFLQDHRSALLRYLDGSAPRSPAEPDALEFVHLVLDEWSDKFAGRKLRSPCLRERTFWFALYQLEELVENPVQGQPDPYELVLMKHIAIVRELLRDGSELPEDYYATRPGELYADAP